MERNEECVERSGERIGVPLDDSTAVGHLKKLISEFVSSREWEAFHNPKDLAAAIAVEASELQELFLWKSVDEVVACLSVPGRIDEVTAELADILILCCSLANRLGIDMSAAVVGKLSENEAKYPVAMVRGRADKYTVYETAPGRNV